MFVCMFAYILAVHIILQTMFGLVIRHCLQSLNSPKPFVVSMTSPTGVIDFFSSPTTTPRHDEARDSIAKSQWYLFAIALVLGTS